MTAYNFGDVILVPFPFTDQSQAKQRPAVVVSSVRYNTDRPDLILMAITSQVRSPATFGEVIVQHWQAAKLLKLSAIKAQQTLAHYEGGKLRVAVAQLAQTLGVSVEELVGVPTRRAGKRGPTPKLQQKIERLSDLPQAKQRLVMEMLEGVLMQTSR